MKFSTKSIDRVLRYLLPNAQIVVWAAIFFSVLAMGPRMMNIDGDLGRHITIGNHILVTRSIPTEDVFSHSMAGEALTPHEWLAQVLFALAHRWLGLDGVVLLSAIVIATSFWLVLRAGIQRSGSLMMGLLVSILAAGASSLHWLTRPHIFTFLFLALWVTFLEQVRRGQSRAWIWLPLTMLLWVNTHGAFIAGIVVWLIYVAGWIWERWIENEKDTTGYSHQIALIAGGVTSLLVTLLNPDTFHIWATSVGYVGNEYLVGHTAEYLSPDFHDSSTWLFLLLVMATMGAFGLSGKRRNATDLMLVCAWAAMSLFSARNIPLFAIVAAPVVAMAGWEVVMNLAQRKRPVQKLLEFDRRILYTESMMKGWGWLLILVVGVGAAFQGGAKLDALRVGNQFDDAVFPVQAINWLAENPQPGEMMNYFPWGGYILYRDWPEMRVFIDGQTDFYGEALTREYEVVLQVGEGWEKILAKYQVGWIIWPKESRLAETLSELPGWKAVYHDDTAVIYSRLDQR